MEMMGDIFSVSFFMMLLQIVMVDILLGGDNAIVIAWRRKSSAPLQKTAIILGTEEHRDPVPDGLCRGLAASYSLSRIVGRFC